MNYYDVEGVKILAGSPAEAAEEYGMLNKTEAIFPLEVSVTWKDDLYNEHESHFTVYVEWRPEFYAEEI